MLRRAWYFVILLGLTLSTGRCSLTDYHAEPPPSSPRTLAAEEHQLVRADNRFGLTLFRTISTSEPDANVFISPLSVSMALGMTLNGARGDTRTAMQKTLELSGLSPKTINASYEHLMQLLVELDPNVQFDIANSIWYRNDFEVESAFVESSQEHFDAEVAALNFSSPEAIGTINRWVETHTQGKIDRIINQIDSNEVMFLINALHFEGTWTYAFDEANTHTAAFTQHDGATTQVPMMQQQADLPYFETDGFQAVDLPYGDSLYSMTLFLPRAQYDVDSFVDTLDAERWDAWMKRFAVRDVDLQLPRFTLAYEKRLDDVLKHLGMELAFTCRTADFSGISTAGDLCISQVKHKSYVEVHEEGTEAAAATSVGMRLTSVGGGPIPMHVNRPFVFVIRERHSGTLLFVGKVNRL